MLFLNSSFVSSRSSRKSDEARSAGWDCENHGPLKGIYFKYIYMCSSLRVPPWKGTGVCVHFVYELLKFNRRESKSCSRRQAGTVLV